MNGFLDRKVPSDVMVFWIINALEECEASTLGVPRASLKRSTRYKRCIFVEL